MALLAAFAAFFRTYNPSGGGREVWNMWCQAFVSRAAKALGSFVRDYGSARLARGASGPLNPDLSQAPAGAIGWWFWEPWDHVAIYCGNGVWMMGSRHISQPFGGVTNDAGYVTHADFQARAGLKFLGWSPTNGGNVVPVEIPALPKPRENQRQIGSANANKRTHPAADNATSPITSVIPANAIVDIEFFVTNGKAANGTTLWARSGSGWLSFSTFTDRGVQGLVDKTADWVWDGNTFIPKPPPVVVAPEPAPEPTPIPEPAPEPEAPTPEPEPEAPIETPEPEAPVEQPEPELPEPPAPKPPVVKPTKPAIGGVVGAIIALVGSLVTAIIAFWPWK